MFKLLALFALLAAASAAPGLLAHSPFVAPAAVVAHAPIVAAPALAYHAPIVKPVVPLATSYAHQYRVDYKTPIIAAAPYAYAPYAYAHAPFLKTFIH
ncbi:cuticle protein 12.5-like [Hetaerina americana]|uniref:cuticle protein 12.5-like n=1 Tax=Hetaerina americana TaxID=62018 RepID=UPI003A7F60B9